jgi:hypothetical protein
LLKKPIGRITTWNYINCMRMITNIMTNNDPNNKAKIRQAYIDHYAHVRAVVPKDNLLEFRSEDGWEPLCKFLGKPVPEGSYPHVNDAKALVKLHHFLWWSIAVKYVVWNFWKAVGPAVGAWMYYRYTRLSGNEWV